MTYLDAWRRLPASQAGLLALLAAAVVAANVHQPYPAIAPLQHLPTIVLLLVAPFLLGRWPITTQSLALLTLFLLLHTLAGRYTYSNVPYDAWARMLSGHDISSTFGLARNDFDRVVHLGFGLLWIQPVAEVAERHGGTRRRTATVVAWLFVGAASAAYEIFEWLLTIIVSPRTADDYNGQQGDMWDSQKDMAAAIVGASIAAVRSLARGRGQA